jgi:hypothetical protein
MWHGMPSATTADVSRNTMGVVNGLRLNGAPLSLHFAKRQISL